MKVITTITVTEDGVNENKLTRKALLEYYDSLLSYLRNEFKEETHTISIQVNTEEEE